MVKFVDYTFNEFVRNCRMLKAQYRCCFVSFFINWKDVKRWRDFVYSLKFEERKKDRIWEYLNSDIPIEKLIKIAFQKRNNSK